MHPTGVGIWNSWIQNAASYLEEERRGSISEGAQVGTPGVEEATESRGDSGKTDG